MKKTELRKIIKESIKQLMTEQGVYVLVSARTCTGGLTVGGLCVPAGAQLGDVYHIPAGATYSSNNRDVFVKNIGGSCQQYLYDFYGQPYQVPPTNCPKCCNINSWKNHASNFGGACTFNCGSTSAGSCNPAAWSNHATWTTNFTNTVNNIPPSATQPCNFLNGKIAQFSANLGGAGGAANVWQCKLDLANQLHTSNNC